MSAEQAKRSFSYQELLLPDSRRIFSHCMSLPDLSPKLVDLKIFIDTQAKEMDRIVDRHNLLSSSEADLLLGEMNKADIEAGLRGALVKISKNTGYLVPLEEVGLTIDFICGDSSAGKLIQWLCL